MRQIRRLLLSEIGYESVDWIRLARGSGQWRVLVNTIIHHRVP